MPSAIDHSQFQARTKKKNRKKKLSIRHYKRRHYKRECPECVLVAATAGGTAGWWFLAESFATINVNGEYV